jgi:hypothetical protein
MRKSLFLFILILTSFSLTCQTQQIANYGVEGWASYTVGGRGGRIIRVTNLNASGTGSFAEAIAASGPRIIVFDVGGVINLNGSSKSIKNPYITIAGQTASGKGITIINGGLSISGHDVILQHISIRPGASGHVVGSWEPDAMSTVGAYNVIIDHCSFSWAVDENCSASGDRFTGATPDDWRKNTSHDVTISNNIIAEGLSMATHSKGEHSKGSLIHDNTSNIAILNNLYACNKDRNPLFKGGARGVIVNNYLYNPGSAAISFGLVDSEWTGYDYQTGRMSVVGNYMKTGLSTNSSLAMIKIGNGPCEVYMSDNISNKPKGIVKNEYVGDLTKIVSVKPIWNDNIHIIPVADVQQNVLKNAGARPWDRDATDTRIMNNMLAGTGSIINYETEVGGYPTDTPSSQPFLEKEWNLDYMLKLSPYVFILTPDSGKVFMNDSAFTVESVNNNPNVSVNYLELLVNGISVGKVTQPPYKWDLNIHNPGNYELVVVADIDNQMKTATKTVRIRVAAPTSTDVKQSKSKTLSCSFSPNPFRGNTNISYNVTKPMFIKLRIYNSMGSQIDTLIDEFQTEGEYTIKWEPKNLSSGIYFSYLMAGSEVLCSKMIYE